MPIYDKPDPTKLHSSAKKMRIRAALAAGCTMLALSPQALAAQQDCGADSHLGTRLYGALDQQIDWSRESLQCESMGRPQGKGIRLRFNGPASESGDHLTVIIALPSLRAGESKKELPANLTLIEDTAGRLFRDSVDYVGDRWTQMVIASIFMGASRFDDIQRECGIATNILADRLKSLAESEKEAFGLMLESFKRPDFREGVVSFMEKRPPKVERL